MTFFRLATLLSVAAALGALGACTTKNTGGGGGAGAVTTSIPGSKVASSLNEQEREQYCKDVTSYLNAAFSETERKKSVCLSSIELTGASTVDEARAMCKEQYNACLSKPLGGDAGQIVENDCSSTSTAEFGNCQATISELNACWQAQAASGKQAFAQLDRACDQIGTDAGVPTVESPQECKSIEAKCPAVRENSAGGSVDDP